MILATRTQKVLGEKGRRIRELTAFVQKRFGFEAGKVEVKKDAMRHVDLYLMNLRSFSPRKSLTAVSAPLLNAKACDTSFWVVWLSVGTLLDASLQI